MHQQLQISIDKIYSVALELIVSLECELNALKDSRGKDTINAKKTMAETLQQLTTLVNQLIKLNQNSDTEKSADLALDDLKIIEEFLNKYK